MNYVDDTNFSWEHEQAHKIFRVCLDAYQDVKDVRYLVQRTIGFDDRYFVWVNVSVVEVWRDVLLKAGKEGGLRALIEKMLQDVQITSHHSKLQDLLALSNVSNSSNEFPANLPKALSELLNIIQKGSLNSEINSDLLPAARACRPSTLIGYRIHRIAYLLQQRFAIDKRFVSLVLTYHQRDQPKPLEFDDLRDVLRALPDNSVFILLGAPGAGKSTLLWRLERDLNEVFLQDDDESLVVPFYVALNRYPAVSDASRASFSVKNWLNLEWQIRYPNMAPLHEIMKSFQVLFLLDGLNEMPYKSRTEQNIMLQEWREFSYYIEGSKHQLLFSCRNLDYTGSLSTPQLPVPQVQIQPLSIRKILSFLEAYAPKHSTYIWRKIKASSGLFTTLNTPFF